MKALPIPIVIEDNDETLVNWSNSERELIYDAGVEAARYMVNDDTLGEQAMICFCLSLDEEPYADIILKRRDILSSLLEAEDFYVSQELYEKATTARTFINQLNIK